MKEYEIIIFEDGEEVGRFNGNRVIGLVDSREQEEDDAFFGGFDDTVKLASAIGRLVCETAKQATETKEKAEVFIDTCKTSINIWSFLI